MVNVGPDVVQLHRDLSIKLTSRARKGNNPCLAGPKPFLNYGVLRLASNDVNSSLQRAIFDVLLIFIAMSGTQLSPAFIKRLRLSHRKEWCGDEMLVSGLVASQPWGLQARWAWEQFTKRVGASSWKTAGVTVRQIRVEPPRVASLSNALMRC